MPDTTTDYERGFRAGIEAATKWHAERADSYFRQMDQTPTGSKRSFLAGRHSFHAWAYEEIRALAPAAPEPLFAPREYEADDFGPIGDAARRICSYAEGEVRKNVYRAAKRELAALQPAPEPSEEEVERLAKWMVGEFATFSWCDADERCRNGWRERARAALAAGRV